MPYPYTNADKGCSPGNIPDAMVSPMQIGKVVSIDINKCYFHDVRTFHHIHFLYFLCIPLY